MIEFLSLILPVLFAGMVTSLLPCTLPILLGFLGILAGTEEQNLKKGILLKRTFFFFLGLAAVFIFFGTAAGFFGQLTSTTLFLTVTVKSIVTKVGGVFLIILGLFLLRVLPLPGFLNKVKSFKIPKWLSVENNHGPALLGGIFATGWSPCIGPVLAGIFILAGDSETVLQGAALFGTFALGIAIPMFILAYFYSEIIELMPKYSGRITKIASVIGGIILITLGILFLTGSEGILSIFSESSPLYNLID